MAPGPRRLADERLPGWLQRLAVVGVTPSDPEDVRLQKALVTLSSALMATLAVVWTTTYAVLGLWWSASIPFAYQVASAASIVTFARTKRYRLFRTTQLWMTLVLPFLLQWSLGGFRNSSVVALWGVTSPLGALLFVGVREALYWFAAFVGLIAVSGAIDVGLAAGAPGLPRGVVVAFFVLNALGVSTTAFVLLQYFVRGLQRAHGDLSRKHRELETEQARSERLLLNVLPVEIANRLKTADGVIADYLPSITVLFADIADFTLLTEELAPGEVVAVLDHIFSAWDALAARHGLEKIKTIGDAYMVAGGVPVPRDDHTEAIADMALDMLAELERGSSRRGGHLAVRIGVDTGPAVAGVIGRAKFIYDLWGDTVNMASRMESHGLVGCIQVTDRTYERLRDRYCLRLRGTIDVKGKGPMTTYLLEGRRDGRAG